MSTEPAVRPGVSIHPSAEVSGDARIGAGTRIWSQAQVREGAVTRHVPPHGMVYGNPARLRGFVCTCAHPLPTGAVTAPLHADLEITCEACGRTVRIEAAWTR